MKLILVRHAQTTANTKTVILGGREGGRLSARGMRQARALGKRLRRERISEVFCSPANRARQTCAAIVGGRDLEVSFRQELREIEMGRLVGLGHEDAQERYPGVFEEIFARPLKRIPGGESVQDVRERVMPLIEGLAQRPGNPTILAVGHNIVNRVVIASLIGLPLEYGKNIKQKNACFSVLDVVPGRSRLYTLDNSLHSIR